MSELETKAVEVIDRAEDALGALIEKVAALTTEYGPEAVDLTLEVARFTAIRDISVGGLVLLFLVIPLLTSGVIFAKKCANADNGIDEFYGWCAFWSFAPLIPAVVVALAWADLWAWVGAFEPRLYLAHLILDGVVK